MSDDMDDKPTVVLDLNALKKHKSREDEDLARNAEELEFVKPEPSFNPKVKVVQKESLSAEDFAVEFLAGAKKQETQKVKPKVILFDFGSNFFQQSLGLLPVEYEYKIVNSLGDLNKCLGTKSYEFLMFNYDAASKAVNQLSPQIKNKFPGIKMIIMARSISPEKAKKHAATAAGVHGYYQYPLEPKKIALELARLERELKKVS